MPFTKKASEKEKEKSVQQSTDIENKDIQGGDSSQMHPSTILQRAQEKPSSLKPDQVLQLQRTVGNQAVGQLLSGTSTPSIQRQENNTGLPDHIKTGVESLSGESLDDVKVHYNSVKPGQLQANAYTEGSEIHVGPGQEGSLSHEAWHVTQQKQGRVSPSIQMKGKFDVNLDRGLEREADVMGSKAERVGLVESRLPSPERVQRSGQLLGQSSAPRSGTPVRQFDCPIGRDSRNRQRDNARNAQVQQELDTGLLAPDLDSVPRTDTLNTLKSGTIAKIRELLTQKGDLDDDLDYEGTFTLGDTLIRDEVAKRGLNDMVVESQLLQTYIINDTAMKFYSARSGSQRNRDKILSNGLRPPKRSRESIKSTRENTRDASTFNSAGWLYLGYTPKIAVTYANMMARNERGKFYDLYEFTLPANTAVVNDPEIPNALRTRQHIPASNITQINRITGKHVGEIIWERDGGDTSELETDDTTT